MSFHVIAPPADQEKFAEQAKALLIDAARLGMNLDPLGFLQAWGTSTRVIVERQDGVVVSMALVVSGMQWSRNLETATVLDIRGNVEALLEFVKSMVIAMGSKRLMIERPDMCSSILDNALTFLQANPGSDNQTALTHALKAYESEGRVYGIVELGLE